MNDKLDLGFKLIPREYVTQKGGMIGITGSGKSNAIATMIEEFIDLEIPTVVVDLLGAHHGMRTDFPIPIFGGEHGDIDINPNDGIEVARTIVELNLTCIIDLSIFDDDSARLFFADFARQLFLLNTTARHLFVEETELFAPQVKEGKSRESLDALNAIMKRGRMKGLGVTFITQRPQDLNKKVLSQSQCTIILHLEQATEIEAVENLFKKTQSKEKVKRIIDDIVAAKAGEGVLYSPSWLGIVKKVKFRKRRSYDSGRTPKHGEELVLPQYMKVATEHIIKKLNNEEEIEEVEDAIQINVKQNQYITGLLIMGGVVVLAMWFG